MNISGLIPPKTIAEVVDEHFDAQPQPFPSRSISAGSIGDPCTAFLSFTLRGFPNNPIFARLRRIFRMGHVLEDEIVKDLKAAGVPVWDRDPLTGKQFTYEMFGGHIRAKADGQLEWCGTLHLLEIKSMNDAQWKKFKEDGVRLSHPKYFAQVQFEMGLSKIQNAVIFSYNKNTSEQFAEVIPFDDFTYASLLQRAETVLKNEGQKIATDESDWRCKFCPKSGVCWQGAEVPKTCQTCRHSLAWNDRKWFCLRQKAEATAVCGEWEVYKPKDRT